LTRHVIEIKEQEVTMKRIFYIVILLALTPTLVNAFGLGNLDLNSALNEPFDARIQLLSPTADELDSLKINLADSEAFARAKVDRPFILSKLRFELRRSVDDGPDYIRVYSQDPIREPFLNFLVEVSWSNGRLFREYTVLLDPPLYDPNARAKDFVRLTESESLTEAVTIDDPDHLVTYGEAYEKFSSTTSTSAARPSYTPSVDYTGGDYGPTTSSDTLWSIASGMRPDTSISVNQMMLALLRANPDAFINQNINGLKRGQILRAPNESELNALSNAEALAEAKSHSSAWGDIRDNLSAVVSERPEVASVSETETTVSEEMETEGAPEAELKLVSADDEGEATEQVSSVDSGTGEELILAQETIQVLTQENIELKDRVKESDALLEDLKRLLSLKDDELAAIQEQMAAEQAQAEMEEAAAIEEAMMQEAAEEAATAEEEVAEVEEEIMQEAEEEVAAIEEEVMEEAEEEVVEAEEEVMEEAAEAEEEVMEVMETEPEPASAGIMGMVEQYLGPVKEIVLGNPMIGMAIAGLIVVLLIVVVVLKFRKEPAETVHIDAMTEEAFPDFDSGDLGDTGAEVDSEAVTVLPDAEAETEMPEEESADFDLDLDEEEEKTQFIAQEETEELPEEEEEDDPLQEVNTYLAFEQFDQAEEFVRNVISNDPENPEYHTKLLEVFYTSGNKKSYEEAAKVLHDIVGGEGEHWNMATAMWQEMSPNRALFEAGGDEEEEDDADNTGGFVNVTADEEAGDSSGDLDFDIGGAAEAPAEEPAAAEEEMLDITGSSEGEDLLDVTAAVGLGDEIDSEAETAQPVPSEDVLDISGTGGEDLLDLTASDESTGEDLLDVTAAANLDLDSEEDLLDVTAATSAGADSSDLLEIESEGLDMDVVNESDSVSEESNEIEFDMPAEGSENETVEFDLGTEESEAETPVESSDDENVLDFDMTSDNEIEVDVAEPESVEPEDAGLEIDLGTPEEDEEPIRLDVEEQEGEMSLDMDMSEPESDEGEISLDLDMNEDEGGVELDLSEDDGGIELDLSIEEDETPEPDVASSDVPEMDFDLSLDEGAPEESAGEDFDLDGTVELPKNALPVEEADDDDDDDEDHTVFVPRAAQPEEQSAEDEIATKLDLAKAYVELGDKDSAKTILDEVMAEGNDEQRKQAEDLLGQV
jgi:pilus assembly protein FimV